LLKFLSDKDKRLIRLPRQDLAGINIKIRKITKTGGGEGI
jgi:hypothetical protein